MARRTPLEPRTYTYYTYAQDQFKLRPNLTLTHGVGWEIDTPLTAINNGGIEVNCYRPGVQSTVFPKPQLLRGSSIYPGQCRSEFLPRTRREQLRLGLAQGHTAPQRKGAVGTAI